MLTVRSRTDVYDLGSVISGIRRSVMGNEGHVDALIECRTQSWLGNSKYFAVCRCPPAILIVQTGSQGALSRPDLGVSGTALWQAGAAEAAPIAQSLLGMSVQGVLSSHLDCIEIRKESVRIVKIREQPSSFSKMLEIHADDQVHKFDAFLNFDDIQPFITIFKGLIPGKIRLIVNEKEIPQ